MAVTYFPVPIDVGELGIAGDIEAVWVQISVRAETGEEIPVMFPADGKMFASGSKYRFKGGSSLDGLQLPTKTGANLTDWEYEARLEVERANVPRQVLGPYYLAAPTTTTAKPLASWAAESFMPASWMTAATAQLQAAGNAALAPTLAAKDAAIVAKDQAVAAKTEMEAILVTDLGTTDGQSAALINTEASATRGALNAAIAEASNVHIIALWGQSNMSGRGAITNASITDPTNSRIFQVGFKNRTLRAATEPLDHRDDPTGIGPGLQFARHYLRDLPPNDVVVLVPSAQGSTALVGTTTQQWQWGGVANNLSAGAMSHLATAITRAETQWPGAKITVDAILWLQGEQDGQLNVPASTYQTQLDALIAGVRATYPDVPFILGPMVADGLAVGTRAEINTVHSQTPLRVPRTGYSLAPAVGAANQNGDNLHYNAAGQRINGERMYAEYVRARSGLAPTGTVVTPVVWSDDFNRADGPVTTTPTGAKAWVVSQTAGAGVAAVSSNTLALSNTTPAERTFALVDSGLSNGRFLAKVATLGDTNTRLVYRYVDADNYMYIDINATGAWRFRRVSAGTDTNITSTTTQAVVGDLLEVVLAGTSVTLKVNDVQAGAGSLDFHTTGTKFGVSQAITWTARWDDLSFRTS